jgi:hypothetical protein
MAFFKTKQEKEIIAQMERDEQLEVFNEQIKTLKAKREEYATIAAEAELNNDAATYDVACNAMLELNEVISSLMQTKANFDIINVSNSIATTMATAMNALDVMAGNKANLPDIRKIQRTNAKVQKYMRNIKISNKAMTSAMRSSNPANKTRSAAEMDSIRPMIDAARAKMTTASTPRTTASNLDISAEIESEKNRLI